MHWLKLLAECHLARCLCILQPLLRDKSVRQRISIENSTDLLILLIWTFEKVKYLFSLIFIRESNANLWRNSNSAFLDLLFDLQHWHKYYQFNVMRVLILKERYPSSINDHHLGVGVDHIRIWLYLRRPCTYGHASQINNTSWAMNAFFPFWLACYLDSWKVFCCKTEGPFEQLNS